MARCQLRRMKSTRMRMVEKKRENRKWRIMRRLHKKYLKISKENFVMEIIIKIK